MFFSITNKNLNWEIITKNLVTFKRWHEVNGEGSQKNFRGLYGKPKYRVENYLKTGRGLISFPYLREAWQKKRGVVVFLRVG